MAIRRRLLATGTAGVLALGLLLTPTTAVAEPPPAASSIQLGFDNPSGKVRADGSPLSRTVTRPPRPQVAAKTMATPAPECPPTVSCEFIPAAYHNNNPADPVDWGNYDIANRPSDGMAINSVVLHDTEGTLQEVLDAFRDPQFYVSCHYVVAPDGKIYQMVRLKDVAWHAGNWWYNMHSVCIEHVGYMANGLTDYTPAMKKASAALVKWLAAKFRIPKDRKHIIGHDNVPATSTSRIPGMHVDMGPFWDSQGYMAEMGAPVLPTGSLASKMVTIAPIWPLNKQVVTGCTEPGTARERCVPPGLHPTNFVYVRTAPDPAAALLTDPVGGPGTTDIANTYARAYHGQQFMVNTVRPGNNGLWYQIWYNGQLGWFHSPVTAPAAFPVSGKYVTPKVGKTSVPLYGRPLPEQSEYPADFAPPAGAVPYPAALQYAMAAGQKYVLALDAEVTTDHFYSWTFDSRLPYDHTVFTGATKYLGIWYNGRLYFVKKADVEVRATR